MGLKLEVLMYLLVKLIGYVNEFLNFIFFVF